MNGITLTVNDKPFKKFSSARQFGIYALDILIRISILVLFTTFALSYKFLAVTPYELANYAWMYVAAIVVWGLLLIKYILKGKGTFEKTKFDLFFMGILCLFLLSVLFANNRMVGIFGSFNTWSYSIITFLSVSILYYVAVIVFRYPRGVKWFGLAFLLSLLIPGIYYTLGILQEQESSVGTFFLYILLFLPLAIGFIKLFKNVFLQVLSILILLGIFYFSRDILSSASTGGFEYIKYCVLALPLSISMIFLFRKLSLKSLAFAAMLANLFLVGYYANFLRGAMFILSVGVLTLFVLFYFAFWIKNGTIIVNFLKELFSNLKNFEKVIRKRKREATIFVMMIFMAAWILGFAIYSFNYFNTNIGPYLGDWVREDVGKIDSVGAWIIGENNLDREFSSLEVLNIQGNYGIIATAVFLASFLYAIYSSGKLTLKVLETGNFRNIVLLSTIFITFVIILINFLLSRFSSFTYLLLIFAFAILAIISSIYDKKDLYALANAKEKLSSSVKIVKALLIIVVIALTSFGVYGILSGIETGVF